MQQMTGFDADILKVVRSALWHESLPKDLHVDSTMFEEFRQQALLALPADILDKMVMEPDLREKWQKILFKQVAFNMHYSYIQNMLPLTVPYAILKGTESAKYYPQPELRAMGDIDIFPARTEFETACRQLMENGWIENTDPYEKEKRRHRQFGKNRIIIEVHAYYAYSDDKEYARILDELILSNIQPDHSLPDMINGLVLIDHINHHMEYGLGLRQIIDWMVFVYRCLSDEKWPEFQTLVRQTGHEKLAKITTRMCEIYLGLPVREWCADVDNEICAALMRYVLTCGNFGNKQKDRSRVSTSFFSSMRSLGGMFRFLQGRGLNRWPAARKYRFLRPFAWIRQLGHYLVKGISRERPLSRLQEEYGESQRRNELFDQLGITREQRGLVSYRNGEYVKE